MRNTREYRINLWMLLSAALMTTSANANNLTTKLCTSGEAVVCLSETFDPVQSERYGSNQSFYSITNNTNQRIFGFGVTNTHGDKAYVGNKYQGAWGATTLSQTQWDAGEIAFGSETSSGERQLNWISGSESIDGAIALGSFAKLFGEASSNHAEPLHVNFYWNFKNYYMLDRNSTLGVNYAGSGWTTSGQFYFQGLPESTATFFGQTGNVIASTESSATDPFFGQLPSSSTTIAAVPEPQTYLMFVLGLGVLSLARRRA